MVPYTLDRDPECPVTLLFDDEDMNIVEKYHLCPNKKTGYIQCRSKMDKKAKPIYLHRLIGKVPKGLVGDHVNGNLNDYRKCNIEAMPQQQNCQKQRKTRFYAGRPTSSKYKGVSAQSNKRDASIRWYASIRCNGVLLGLGLHEIPELAAVVYNIFALILFTKTNLNEVDVTQEQLAQVDFPNLINHAIKNLSNHGLSEIATKLEGITEVACLAIWNNFKNGQETV